MSDIALYGRALLSDLVFFLFRRSYTVTVHPIRLCNPSCNLALYLFSAMVSYSGKRLYKFLCTLVSAGLSFALSGSERVPLSSLSGFAALLCVVKEVVHLPQRGAFFLALVWALSKWAGVHSPAHSLKTHVFCIIACTGLYTLKVSRTVNYCLRSIAPSLRALAIRGALLLRLQNIRFVQVGGFCFFFSHLLNCISCVDFGLC